MPDDLTRRSPEDPNKINVNQSWEVDYWTKKLGVDAVTLKKAVSTVGHMVADVKKWLKTIWIRLKKSQQNFQVDREGRLFYSTMGLQAMSCVMQKSFFDSPSRPLKISVGLREKGERDGEQSSG